MTARQAKTTRPSRGIPVPTEKEKALIKDTEYYRKQWLDASEDAREWRDKHDAAMEIVLVLGAELHRRRRGEDLPF